MFDNPPMRSSKKSDRLFRFGWAIAPLLALTSTAGIAARPAPELGSLRAQFPSSTIDSVERADAALAATAGAKGQVEKGYKSDSRGCMTTFMVNDCLDKARELQRKRLSEIDGVELEANRFKRKDHADKLDADRARRESERVAGQKADTEQRSRNRQSYDEKQTRAKRDEAAAAESAKNRKPTAKKPPVPVPVTEAAQRAKNAADYTTKVTEARTHQQEIARRIAAKDADRKRRGEEKAEKDAKTAATVRP